jgi:hypothetical protein
MELWKRTDEKNFKNGIVLILYTFFVPDFASTFSFFTVKIANHM